MKNFFTSADINELKANPSEYVKLNLIGKIASGYTGNLLSDNEKAVAGDILRLLAHDISLRIRINISEKFCRSESIPYDVVKKLANDIEDLVAVPVVQFSNLLNEDDLLEIVKKDTDGRQRAVARRDGLSEKLVGEIIAHGSQYTVESLIDSNGADISVENSRLIINKFGDNENLIGELISIKKLKPEAVQDILSMVSDDLRKQIIYKYNIPKSVVDSLVSSSTESVSHGLVKSHIIPAADTNAPPTSSLDSIVAKLHKEKQLHINLIVKILSSGNTNFLILSLAELASIPTKNVIALIEEEGNAGIAKLFEKSNLPKTLATATKILYRIVEKEIAEHPHTNTTEVVTKQLDKLVTAGDENHLRYILNVIKAS